MDKVLLAAGITLVLMLIINYFVELFRHEYTNWKRLVIRTWGQAVAIAIMIVALFVIDVLQTPP